MASIQDIKKRFLDLQGREMTILAEAIQANEEPAMQLVAEQLAQGIKSDGEPANFTYAPFTIASKRNKPGLAGVTDHLTNYDTGESYRNLYLKVDGVQIEFGTNTDKEDDISDRMDGEAFRPTPRNKEELINQHIQPTFNKMIRELLKL